jgi:hypothetical protein
VSAKPFGTVFFFILTSVYAAGPTPPECKWAFTPVDMKDEVPGLTIGNTHYVYQAEGRGTLIRGRQLGGKTAEVKAFGVTDVLVYKDPVKNEVTTELNSLRSLGYTEDHLHHVTMPWQQIRDDKIPCQHTIEAANILLGIARIPGSIGYFHCTYGQDRTGMMAAIIRMVTQGWSAEQAFFSEMCAHGYGHGDPKRPGFVSDEVESSLTPIFLQIAGQIQGQGLSVASTLDAGICEGTPKTALDANEFKCK